MTGSKQAPRILLIEDEPVVALIESRDLVSRGYEVSVARTGEEAIRIAGHDMGIDMIVSDVELGPGIDGIEAAKTIVGARRMPVLFMTSCSEEELGRRTEGLGPYRYLSKKADKSLFFAAVKDALVEAS